MSDRLKILAIDDDPEFLAALQGVISGALPGAAVFTAADGAGGLALALAEDPDVVLLDITMPGMDGYEVCRRVKADDRLKNIPVVFITAAQTGKEGHIRALEAGGEGFLQKFGGTEELAAQIRAMAKIKAANTARSQERVRLETLVAERTRSLQKELAERRQAETELRETSEMQSALNAMLQFSLANRPLSEKLGSHLAAIFALPWLALQPKGAVFLMNPKRSGLALTAQRGLAPALQDACANVPLGRCLCGKAAATGRIVESVCAGGDHRVSCEGTAPHGHYCAPILAGGRTLGVLNLYLKEGGSLTAGQRRFIKSVLDVMAENILHALTEARLAHSQRMESVGRLAGGVAHDFNNILTAVKCFAEFVIKALEPRDPKADDVREILTATDRAVALTRQLLAFSRRQIMASKVVDLNMCVADVINMLRHLIGEDIALTTKLAPAPCLALLDTGQMEQVLVNLVVNARDAMPKGGGITLATELLPGSEALYLAHPDLPRGPMVCLKVSDTGSGMSAEVKNHLFEPFFTTKERGRGTGLGLSTVFGIVKQSGGDIEVESEPGKGTLFTICFPAGGSAPLAAEASAGAPAGRRLKGRETILLVEDEESLRRLGKRMLESSGYTVLAAAGGPEALRVIEAHGKSVDLLVADVILPGGMSGRDLARELSRKEMMGRTLYMSGYTDDAIVNHGVLEPGLAFIYKPFSVDGMLAKVRAVLDSPADQAQA